MARKTFKEILNGPQKLRGKSIKSASAKKARKEKVKDFVIKYGRGDKGLNKQQKQARIEKFIEDPEEIKKLAGIDITKRQNIKKDKFLHEDFKGHFDDIPKELIANLDKYPRNKRTPDQDERIVFMEVKDDGEVYSEHIFNDEHKADPRHRQSSSTLVFNDHNSAINEIKQHQQGILKEVSDRTMAIHEDEEVLDLLLEADEIDTDEDKSLQM